MNAAFGFKRVGFPIGQRTLLNIGLKRYTFFSIKIVTFVARQLPAPRITKKFNIDIDLIVRLDC